MQRIIQLYTTMLKIYGRKKPYSRKSYKYRSKNFNLTEVLKELKIKRIEEGKTGFNSFDFGGCGIWAFVSQLVVFGGTHDRP